MSYTPYERNTSGIVFFGEQGSQSTYYSDSNFVIEDGAAGHIKIPHLIISDGGNIGSASDEDAISIASNGNVTMSQNLSLTGNLTVNGTTTTVNSTVVSIQDPILTLGSSGVDDNKDRGIAISYNNSGGVLGFFGHDDSAQGFTYIPSGSFDASSGVMTGGAGWATFAGVSGALVGEVTGNASTATTLATTSSIALGNQLSGSANFDGSAGITILADITADLITDQTAETTVADEDLVLIYDTTASALRKMTKVNFTAGLSGGSGIASFNITDGTTSQTIGNAENIVFASGTGAECVISTDNTVTVNTVDSEIIHDSLSGFVANEHIDHTSVTMTAGAGMTGGGTIAATRTLNVIGGDGITVNADEVEVTVDGSTVELNNTNGAGAVRVKDAGITEVKRSRTTAAITTSVTISTDVALCDSSGGAIAPVLPAVATGKIVYVKKTDTSANAITLTRGGTSTIDGATTKILYSQYENITVVCDGTNWHII